MVDGGDQGFSSSYSVNIIIRRTACQNFFSLILQCKTEKSPVVVFARHILGGPC